jgi:hypothetical protein
VAEQILYGHRPLGRDPVHADLHVLELGKVLRHRRADIELAFFREDHDRG